MTAKLLGAVKHRLFGHTFEYEELDSEETTVVARCVYDSCEYEETLTEEMIR